MLVREFLPRTYGKLDNGSFTLFLSLFPDLSDSVSISNVENSDITHLNKSSLEFLIF